MRRIHDTAACSDRCLEPRRHVLTRQRHVYVHGVTQRLVLVELLHPDRRSVSEWVDRVVVGHREVAEDGTPESDVTCIRLRRHGELHFLDGPTIGDRTVFPRNV